MPWVKLDDHFPDHPKVEGISDGAFRLHVSAMCHAARFKTDGRIGVRRPGQLMDSFRPKYVEELLTARLWEQNGSGYIIHDFTEWNISRERWDKKRETDAERLREWRAKQAEKREGKDDE